MLNVKRSPLRTLESRLADADRLVEIHAEVTGNAPGRRHGYDALNRSAIVLTVGAWEGFCEDLIDRNSLMISRGLKNSAALPESARDAMLVWFHGKNDWGKLSRETKESVWSLSSNGWRKVYRQYTSAKVSALNTPNHENLKKLFSSTLGISNFAQNWQSGKWERDHYTQKLNLLLDLRHRIAHGALNNETVGKTKARDGIALIRRLAGWMVSTTDAHRRSLSLNTPLPVRRPRP